MGGGGAVVGDGVEGAMFDGGGLAVSGGGEAFGGRPVCGDGVGETGVLDLGEGEGAAVGGEED